mmetsp:Transcript_15733/g.59859  ORF Transcript_15733/g.59859 Transcript_15733/m.59859 type:complete len:230 (-) Transcript_15733:2308-2997(-)
MGDDALAVLASGLRHVGASLEGLHLHCNDLTAASMGALATEALPSLSVLQVLSLSNNRLGDDGVEIFSSQGLPHCSCLLELDLSSNGIGERGAAALADGLAKAPKLSELKLNDNLLGDAGAVALSSKAFETKSTPRLITLDLKHNGIGDAGAEALTSGLLNCTKLINFGFRENAVSAAVLRRMKIAFSEALPRLVNVAIDYVDEAEDAAAGGKRESAACETKADPTMSQ